MVNGFLIRFGTGSLNSRGRPIIKHGNLSAELFERWFTDLCRTLSETYGPCIIHLDGAKYHKRIMNPAPCASWRKADIQQWLV